MLCREGTWLWPSGPRTQALSSSPALQHEQSRESGSAFSCSPLKWFTESEQYNGVGSAHSTALPGQGAAGVRYMATSVSAWLTASISRSEKHFIYHASILVWQTLTSTCINSAGWPKTYRNILKAQTKMWADTKSGLVSLRLLLGMP